MQEIFTLQTRYLVKKIYFVILSTYCVHHGEHCVLLVKVGAMVWDV